MKKILFLLFVFAFGKINAQSYEFIIQMNDETEIVWNSESLQNVYFENDSILIVVEKVSGYTHPYKFSEIRKIYFQSDVSVNDFCFEENLFVFPNPAKDNIKIVGVEGQEIEILSADGKVIRKEHYDGKNIDVSTLPQGVYLIKTNSQTLKFNKI